MCLTCWIKNSKNKTRSNTVEDLGLDLALINLSRNVLAMFSSQEYLDKKTGPHGVGRFSYLQSLVTEFQDTDLDDAKEQVLANLANFAYDPINYDFLRDLNVIDLFLDCLSGTSENQTEFAIGGLCNLALDRQNKAHILKNDGVQLVKKCLSSPVEETVLSAITTLMYLVTPASKAEITDIVAVDAILQLSKSSNTRLSNLAKVFLKDYCSEEQIAAATEAQRRWGASVQAQASQDSHSLEGAIVGDAGSYT